MIQILDLFGTFVFALTGSLKAVKYKLDLLGVLVLATATGIGGGIIRDVLLGNIPPMSVKNESYLLVCILAGLITFFAGKPIQEKITLINYLDAVGLGVFGLIGFEYGLKSELGIMGIVIMGVMSAVGGGVIRDILVREIPLIICKDFYASAVVLGGFFFVALRHWNFKPGITSFFVITVIIVLRVLAILYNINLPKANSSNSL